MRAYLLAARVPVPVLPPEPADYSIHPIAAVLLCIMGVAVIAFGWVVLRYSYQGPRTGQPPPWRLVRRLVGVAGVAFAVGLTIATVGEHRAEVAGREYEGTLGTATAQVRERLEQVYGVTWQYYSYIPVEDDDWGRTELLLPDGSAQDCFIVTEDGYYAIRCGGDTPDESEALEPVDR